MTRSKSIVGALVLFALAICAFGAASASAEGEKGLTASECKKVGVGNEFNSSQCITGAGSGEFATVPFEGTKKVEATLTQNTHKLGKTTEPVAKFMGEALGLKLTVTCGKGKITGGEVTNTLEGEIHRAHGTKGVVTYEECHASKTEETKSICKVKSASGEGIIKTNALTTTNIGVHHELEIKPEIAGQAFAEFEVLKKDAATPECFTVANLPIKVTGNVKANANTETHNHITLTTTTNGTEFKANGGEAMYESTQTFWLNASGEKIAIGATTVTPTD
jgi:hypothetical protein